MPRKSPEPWPATGPSLLSPEELLADGALTMAGAVAFSSVSERELQRAIHDGELESFKRGRIRLIPRRALVLYLASDYRRDKAAEADRDAELARPPEEYGE